MNQQTSDNVRVAYKVALQQIALQDPTAEHAGKIAKDALATGQAWEVEAREICDAALAKVPT